MPCGRWSVGLRGCRRKYREGKKGGKEGGTRREGKKRERTDKKKKKEKKRRKYDIFDVSKSQEM